MRQNQTRQGTRKRILIVAPHPDDETLGVGGTITKLSDEGHHVHVLVVSGHLPPLYDREVFDKTVAESKVAFEILGVSSFRYLEIPATTIGMRPVQEVNGLVEEVVSEYRPDVVFCPYPDRHVDHRVVFDTVLVASRPIREGRDIEMVAAYETLSETHWNAPHIEPNFTPNWVVDITEQIDRKSEALRSYQSQISESSGPRSVDVARALARFRGSQAGVAYGEAFQVIRMLS